MLTLLSNFAIPGAEINQQSSITLRVNSQVYVQKFIFSSKSAKCVFKKEHANKLLFNNIHLIILMQVL